MSSRAAEDTPGVRRAWGWVEHLRGGGTTPWRDWATEGRAGGRVLPGAQQLELLRRLNLVGAPTTALASRVLEASAPGRGRPDLELAGAVDPLAFGPPPVDPADLPDDELLRVATSLLADDLIAAGLPEPRPTPRRRPWARRYRLVGDPVLADAARAGLVARGRPPGGRGSIIVVLGTDLGQMLVDTWTTRSLENGAPPWRDWIDPLTRDRTLPPRVDLPRVARDWTDRVGPERVRVVIDPDELRRIVGVRRPLPGPPDLSADAADLARRVGQVLGLLAVPARRQALLRQTLMPRLVGLPGAPLVVPAEHQDWVGTQAALMRDALQGAGYPVHGDPERLLVGARAGVAEPSVAGVLALATRLVLERGGS